MIRFVLTMRTVCRQSKFVLTMRTVHRSSQDTGDNVVSFKNVTNIIKFSAMASKNKCTTVCKQTSEATIAVPVQDGYKCLYCEKSCDTYSYWRKHFYKVHYKEGYRMSLRADQAKKRKTITNTHDQPIKKSKLKHVQQASSGNASDNNTTMNHTHNTSGLSNNVSITSESGLNSITQASLTKLKDTMVYTSEQ